VSVQRAQTPSEELAVGVWKDGRIGTYRGLKTGKEDYGVLVYGTKGIERSGNFGGYGDLIKEIVQFFKTGKAPVSPEETIEIFAFMTAADESKAKNGASVTLASVLEEAQKQNAARH
jgi:hypothetical protein